MASATQTFRPKAPPGEYRLSPSPYHLAASKLLRHNAAVLGRPLPVAAKKAAGFLALAKLAHQQQQGLKQGAKPPAAPKAPAPPKLPASLSVKPPVLPALKVPGPAPPRPGLGVPVAPMTPGAPLAPLGKPPGMPGSGLAPNPPLFPKGLPPASAKAPGLPKLPVV
jgi:hypothetical protein